MSNADRREIEVRHTEVDIFLPKPPPRPQNARRVETLGKQWVAGASVAPKVSVRAVRRETPISEVQQRAFVGEIGNIVANNKTDKTGHPFPLAGV